MKYVTVHKKIVGKIVFCCSGRLLSSNFRCIHIPHPSNEDAIFFFITAVNYKNKKSTRLRCTPGYFTQKKKKLFFSIVFSAAAAA